MTHIDQKNGDNTYYPNRRPSLVRIVVTTKEALGPVQRKSRHKVSHSWPLIMAGPNIIFTDSDGVQNGVEKAPPADKLIVGVDFGTTYSG